MKPKLLITLLLIPIAAAAGLVLALKHERNIVKNTCSNYAAEIFTSKKIMQSLKIPTNTTPSSFIIDRF